MRICRFDEDRLGIVCGTLVHDVTDLQTQIRAAAPYDMKGDAVIAALPDWGDRLATAAAKARGVPLSAVTLRSPVARPSKAMAAPTNYADHVAEMAPGRVATRRLIEFASSFYTLYPGDVFYIGTPSGVGPVKPGDTITVESSLIGTMTVPVRAHALGQS